MDALVFISGRQQGQRHRVSGERTRLGRDRGNDILIDDESASRLHAEILEIDGELRLRDNGSTNGTFLNDRRIDESPLHHGDKIAIGDVVLIYQSSSTDWFPTSVSFEEGEDGSLSTHSSIALDQAALVTLPDAEVGEDRTADYFSRLSAFLADVSSLLNLRRLLDVVMDHVFAALRADRGVLLLLNEQSELQPTVLRVREGSEAGSDLTLSQSLLQYVLERGESVLSSDTQADARFRDTAVFKRVAVSSLICTPLKVRDRILGVLYIDTMHDTHPFDPQDLKLLTAMAMQASVCIENARLYEQLMNAMEYRSSVIRCISSGLLVCDAEGVIGTVNQAATQMFRAHESDLTGRRLADLPNLQPLHALVMETLETGSGVDRREVVVSAATREIPLGVTTSVLENHVGHVIGVVVNFRNLTQIRELGEQVRMSQHLAALGEMATSVAHEVRNPLNSIRGFAQILREKELGDPHDGYLDIIVEEVDRMERLVRDMLDYGRPGPPRLKPVNLNALVRDVVAECRPTFDQKGVSVETDLAEDLPGATADDEKLKQVLLNLIGNAVEAMEKTPEAERRLEIATRAETDEQSRRLLCVSVRDHGVGMTPDVAGRVFEPFFADKEGGTGLGLSICRKIMVQHKGCIDVESAPRKGSTFTFRLPATPPPVEARYTPPPSAPPG